MAAPQLPAPPLDGAPPSPPGVGAQAPDQPQLSQLNPSPNMGGNLQVTTLGIQTAAAVMKGLDLLGQIFPGFAPTSAMLQAQLKAGFKSAIQQGPQQGSEPMTPPQGGGMGMLGQSAQAPGTQQPLPPMPSGM